MATARGVRGGVHTRQVGWLLLGYFLLSDFAPLRRRANLMSVSCTEDSTVPAAAPQTHQQHTYAGRDEGTQAEGGPVDPPGAEDSGASGAAVGASEGHMRSKRGSESRGAARSQDWQRGEERRGATASRDGQRGEERRGATASRDGQRGEERRGATASRDGQRGEERRGATASRVGQRGEEREGAGLTQREELKLHSSSFSLVGDSAHNQAMVYWIGYNSSVILILTKLFDFNLGTVTDSSLWRSLDLGSSYEKLNDRLDSRLVLSYLYVCPTNQRKILLVCDPELDSSVVLSEDVGNSFHRFSISFTIQSLLFHPSQEDWLLAYSQQQRLYFSEDFGRNWNLVHEGVSPGRFYWAVSGLDKDSDLVHLEAQDPSGMLRYITCLAGSCANSRKFPFTGRIDGGSLVVQDDFVFVQVTTVGPTKYFVSYQRQPFQNIQLPKYCLPKDMHIISTEGQVLAGVQQWNENDTYSLYMSDRYGNYFSPALTFVRVSRSVTGILNMDVYQVAGVSGVLLANRKLGGHVRTFISFSQGQRWRLLTPPATEQHCSLPSCSLHLHLRLSESPYSPDSITSTHSAPGLIIATGTVGSELSNHNTKTFLSSDAGKTWRKVFDEERRMWFLDKGGALMAITQASVPINHLWLSIDEGRSWLQHRFSLSPLFVDGALMEEDTHHHIITIFGHLSHRSDWQLITVDYSSLFSKQCTSGDFHTWSLVNQGETCVMGQRQIFRKRRPGSRCILGRRNVMLVSSESCTCTPYDFECDYGFERQTDGRCSPSFWYRGSWIGTNCTSGQSSGYRKIVNNSCEEPLEDHFIPIIQQCESGAPSDVHLSTAHGDLTAQPHTNITFLIHIPQVISAGLDIQLDLGDNACVSLSVGSPVSDSTTHVYTHTHMYTLTGIYRVSTHVRNSLGATDSQLFMHITTPVEKVVLLAPRVQLLGQHTNLSALLLPDTPKTAVYYWWIDNSTEPLVTLEGWLLTEFHQVGISHVSLQVASAGVVHQDRVIIRVTEVFRSVQLAFSPNLEEHNPDNPEWREDLARVVTATISQVTGMSTDWLLVCVFPGPPTAAEVFLLPPADSSFSHTHTHHSTHIEISQELDKMSQVLADALNQNWVEFQLSPEVRITAQLTHLGLVSQVSSGRLPGVSVLLLFLLMALLGVITFLMYRFKRNMPWIHGQSEEPQEKQSEVMDTGRQRAPSEQLLEAIRSNTTSPPAPQSDTLNPHTPKSSPY